MPTDQADESTATIIEITPERASELGCEPGFYFRDDEVPDEGWCGPWPSIDDAIEAAVQYGYTPIIPWGQG